MSLGNFLKRLSHPELSAILKLYRKAETMSEEELRSFQISKLREAVSHFYHTFAFYREACDACGIRPEEIQSLLDLSRLPVMDKAILRSREEELRAVAKKAVRRSTSGSTGENFHFYLDESARASHSAFAEYYNARLSLGRGKTVGIWGGNLKKPEDNGFLQKIKYALLDTVLLPGYGMDEARACEYLAFLTESRPAFVYGYPSYLAFLARTGQQKKIPAPRGFVLVASGEQMSPQDREVIEIYFGAVYNRYGSCEFSTIAHELPGVDGFYVNPVQFLLETNERDELLVTDLWNFATPFIRYNIGDRAALKCEGGRCVITELYGRCNDVLFTPSGKMIPSQFWTILSRMCEEVESFQVVQKSETEFVMRVKSEADFDISPILNNFNANFAPEVTLAVTRDEPFETTRMGKHKFVIRKEN